MRRLFVVALFLVAAAANAGLSYNFSSTTDKGKNALVGRVVVEGSKLRIDFQKGDNLLFRDNTIVISKDGGKSLLLVDPAKKSYSQLNVEQLFSALGGMVQSGSGLFDISVKNHKVKVGPAVNGGVIEGYATKKWVVESSYDMTLKLFGEVTQTKVRTSSETWTTDKLSRDYVTFLQLKPFRSGIGELDKFLEEQTKGVEGFPLRQIVTSTTTVDGQTETTKTTVVISGIKQAAINPKAFDVPASFKKQGLSF